MQKIVYFKKFLYASGIKKPHRIEGCFHSREKSSCTHSGKGRDVSEVCTLQSGTELLQYINHIYKVIVNHIYKVIVSQIFLGHLCQLSNL